MMKIDKASFMDSGDPSMNQYVDLLPSLEQQELEAPEGTPSPQVYGQLLAIYLLQNDLPNAKFLWKRIPSSVKDENPELAQLWNVGQELWLCSSRVYSALDKEWPEYLKQIISAISDSVRRRACSLVSKAYSSISVEKASSFLGLSSEDCVDALSSLGWEVDAACKIIKPKVLDTSSEDNIVSEEQLSKLTDFVAFLEN